MLKKTGFIVLLILLFLLISEMMLYFICPVYDFPVPQPFSGNKIYNPYKGMDSTAWRKANFHYHAKAWGGLTSGSHNTYEAFLEIYRKKLGYDFPAISDYMKINEHFKDSAFYIPVYEHGMGVRKKHQILIDAKEVLWYDYSLFQNIHQKQHILSKLQGKSTIIAIAHPDWEDGYSPGDLRLLSGYQLLEILDHNWSSFFQWDAALSSGHPVYILADDDSHDIDDVFQIGRNATFINSRSLAKDSVVNALKEGRAFGADIYMSDDFTDFDKKAEDARRMPVLESVEVRGDTLWVRVSEKAMKITFIGQNMQYRKVSRLTAKAYYLFKPEDTYIRTEVKFFNKWGGPGTVFYLNPVFRYNGEKPNNDLKAEINWPRTFIYRLFSVPALIILIVFFIRIRKKKTPKTTSDA